jgi:hypothetical protein
MNEMDDVSSLRSSEPSASGHEERVTLTRAELMAGILVGVGGEHDAVPTQEQLDRAVGLIFRQARRVGQDTLSPTQVDRLRRFARDLQDAEPDIGDDDRENAYNRGYAAADVATGKVLEALLDVRFNEVLDSPEFRAVLDSLPKAPSEASMKEGSS